MLTKEIKLPENYKKYFKTEDEITDLIVNYIEEYKEKKQDKKIKKELSDDKGFLILNKLMEEKLGAM